MSKLRVESWLAPSVALTRREYFEAVARGVVPPSPAPRVHSAPTTPDEAAAAFLRAVGRPVWHARAACRGMGNSRFFSEAGQHIADARAVCARCAVIDECAAAAERYGASTQGVWAGTSPRERRTARAA